MKQKHIVIGLRILQGTVWIGFFLFWIAFVQKSSAHISYPWGTDYVELPELSRAILLSRGESMYPSWEEAPFQEGNYTPFFTLLHSVIFWFAEPTLFFGRLLNFFFVLITAGILSRIVWLYRTSVFLSLMAGLLYCSSHMVWMWGSLLRVDNLAVLLNLAALWSFVEGWKIKKEERWLYGSIVLAVLAAFTRQTMIASAAAIFLSVLFTERTYLLKLLGVYIGLGLLGTGMILLLSGGWAWEHLVTANMNEYEWTSLRFFYGHCWDLYHWILPALVVGVWVGRKYPVVLLYALLGFLVSLTVGKIGSSLNYLLEMWAGFCILAALGIAKAEEVWEQRNRSIALSFFLWFTFAVGWQQAFHVPWSREIKPGGGMKAMSKEEWNPLASFVVKLPLWRVDPFGVDGMQCVKRSVQLYSSIPARWEAQVMANIDENVRKLSGPVLSEDMNFTVLLGKEIWIQSFEFTQLYRQGHWDIKPLHSALSQKQFSALILMFNLEEDISAKASGQRFLPKTVSIMKENYDLVAQEGYYWIYYPKR
ncbi:MAG: hypothetical protein VX278_24020 [Myxococcota bacterium]|nr:hypothetical protein [Myxococcota bacterium]